jgi:HK97 family phage portal protein
MTTILSRWRQAPETRANVESPQYPLTASTLVDLMTGPRTNSGVVVTEKGSLGLSAVYRAVALLAGTSAGLPFKAYRDGDDDTRQLVRPTPRLMKEPHPDLTDFEWLELVFVHQLLWGNAFVRKLKDQTGITRELWPIEPGRVMVGRASDGHKVYAVDATDLSGRQVRDLRDPLVTPYTDHEILHFPLLGYDGIQGLSPIQAHRRGIGLAMAAEEYGERLYGSGSMLSGILSSEAKISTKDADDIKARWKAQHSGVDNAHDIAVLGAGTKFQPISMPPQDAQFIESRRFQVAEVARIYGVPPHLLMDTERSTSWGTGIETQTTGLVVFTMGAHLTRFERRYSRALLPAPQYSRFTTAGLTRGDIATRMNAYATGRQWGWLSVNDVRRLEDMPPVPDGDAYMEPLNMVPLGTDRTPEPAPTEPPPNDAEDNDDA